MGEVVLGHSMADESNVVLPGKSRAQGLYIIGKNGTGKSALIENLMVQDARNGLGFCLLDPHGDLVEDTLRRLPPHRERDVLLLDAGDPQTAFRLNLFSTQDIHTEEEFSRRVVQIVETFQKVFDAFHWGVQIESTIRMLAYTFLSAGGLTMVEIPAFLDLADSTFRKRIASRVTDDIVRSHWQQFDAKNKQDREQIAAPILNRISAFLLSASLRRIVASQRTTVDFRQAMERHQIVLVKLPVSKLGDNGVSLLGTALIGQFTLAAFSRAELPPSDRHLYPLYLDEYHRFDTPDVGTLFDEARKYGVGLTIAHQGRAQLITEARKAAPMRAQNYVIFGVTSEDADELAGVFDHTPPEPEITGERSQMQLAPDPWAALATHGHPNESVMKYSSQIKELVERARRSFMLEYPPDMYPQQINAQERLRALETLIRTVFAGAQRQWDHPNEQPEGTHYTETTYSYIDDLKAILAPRNRGDPYIERTFWLSEAALEERSSICNLLMANISIVARHLNKEPIRVPGTATIPIRGPLRTYADMHNEIANDLTQLQRRIAWVKLVGDSGGTECVIRTNERFPDGSYESAERVRQRSRRAAKPPGQPVDGASTKPPSARDTEEDDFSFREPLEP